MLWSRAASCSSLKPKRVSIDGEAPRVSCSTADMSSIISTSDKTLDKERFDALWTRCSRTAPDAGTTRIWDNLIRRYTEKHRHYHNKKHLVFCLQQLDLVAPLVESTDTIEMAIWFHDVVYEPMAKDNEQRSAALFKLMTKEHVSSAFIDTVSRIIVATKHNDAPTQEHAAYMLDIDLSSIGLPWRYFLQDCKDLRAETSGISDSRYYSGKIEFFNALLKKQNIYYTQYFSWRYEEKARQNMKRYISWLNSHGYH